MTTYLYPQNLKATANLWLWSLRDFAIMSIALLLSILILAQTRIIAPLAVTLCFGFSRQHSDRNFNRKTVPVHCKV
mgnify:CR=1 FL=1